MPHAAFAASLKACHGTTACQFSEVQQALPSCGCSVGSFCQAKGFVQYSVFHPQNVASQFHEMKMWVIWQDNNITSEPGLASLARMEVKYSGHTHIHPHLKGANGVDTKGPYASHYDAMCCCIHCRCLAKSCSGNMMAIWSNCTTPKSKQQYNMYVCWTADRTGTLQEICWSVLSTEQDHHNFTSLHLLNLSWTQDHCLGLVPLLPLFIFSMYALY